MKFKTEAADPSFALALKLNDDPNKRVSIAESDFDDLTYPNSDTPLPKFANCLNEMFEPRVKKSTTLIFEASLKNPLKEHDEAKVVISIIDV
jgi:hypothetical protein